MTAISVSERLLEMAAFYTWLDFTLTIFHAAVPHSNEKRRGGIAGGLFGSDNTCTRAQIVTFLHRAMK